MIRIMHLRNSENFTQWLTYRLQKLAVIHYVFMFVVTPILSIYFTIKLALSTYWWFLIFYGIWVFYDFRTPERGSRPKEWMRKCIVWKYFADYFPMTLTKVEDLSTNHNYIIGSHPHGILSFGAFATFCTDGTGFSQLFPGLKSYLVTLNGQFWFPFRRDELMLTGAIASSADSLNHILSEENGRAVGVVLGGAEEVLDTNPGSYDLNLSKRRGFIKIALRNGAYLVPMYNFGENNTYSQVLPNYRGSKMRALQRIVKKYWGFCPPLINGCGIFSRSFGLLPRRTPINTVIGRPIVVEKNLNPSQEEIDALHSEYCTQLRKLFDEYKMNFGIDKSITLNIY